MSLTGATCVGEMGMRELSVWAAHVRRRERDEVEAEAARERNAWRRLRRMAGLVGKFLGWTVTFEEDEAVGGAATPTAGGQSKSLAEMKAWVGAWAAANGGRVVRGGRVVAGGSRGRGGVRR